MTGGAELVLRGGRVVDPATGTDDVLDVAVGGGRVTAVGADLLGERVLDVRGCVVAPGFVDLHSHAQSVGGARLQAMDGVTTALDLEAGAPSVARAYELAAAEGRPVHYGFSASWGAARMQVLSGLEPDGRLATLLSHLGDERWQRAADASEQDRLLGVLQDELAAGALGIGVIVGYAPGTDPHEYLRVAALAADAGLPTYTHTRDLTEHSPRTRIDGATELVRAAAETGAHMHYCHVNSTSLRSVDRVLSLVEQVRREGATVTTEAYPYGAGSTGIGAAFLAPERLAERELSPTDLVYVPTGERVADVARLVELRSTDPGGLCIVHFLDEDDAADRAVLDQALQFPDAMVASDAMPLTWRDEPADDVWPLPATAVTHPRTAGTFARSWQRMVVGGGMAVGEFVRRASTLPGEVVAAATRGAVRKGTLEVGADADVVVIDPDRYRDSATYADGTRPTTGVRHLLVAGTQVVRDGRLVPDARPGRPVRG